MNIKELKRITEIMKRDDISELVWEDKDFRLKLKRVTGPDVGSSAFKKDSATPQQIQASTENITRKKAENSMQEGHRLITSPIVGTFYRAPSPKAEPFVKEGDVVEKKQVLCIIEAMKLMNELEAEYPCRIVKILVENAQPVEYGEALFEVEPL